MKKWITLAVCLLLGGGLMAQGGNGATADKPAANTAPAAASAMELVIELSDGSRIIGTPSIDRFKMTTQYADLEVSLSRLLTIAFSGANHAAQVNLRNGDVLSGRIADKEIAMKTVFGKAVIPLEVVREIRERAGAGFVNSLGMKFVSVPGTETLFSIWDTRVQDYRAYADANSGVDAFWKDPGFKQGEDHPVVRVNWYDAMAFCAWLTQKERKEGWIGQDQEYRLPTDEEWSAAAGPDKYPWGNQWPPPKGSGNFDPSVGADDFVHTSPVGSFAANRYGLYDMAGNVDQWCERGGFRSKEVSAGTEKCLVRGSDWSHDIHCDLTSARRDDFTPADYRWGRNLGFRCVLVSGLQLGENTPAAPTPSPAPVRVIDLGSFIDP
ncbi:MAG TPA: SUMF1/EgtB/PvdO family nonheme iron enzyme [Chthoniobacteraceae bacterium]|nr:SUMF1/EgtB/PvdO family nonheme iron enzyme [Chthoniobacteraceae bacterium]